MSEPCICRQWDCPDCYEQLQRQQAKVIRQHEAQLSALRAERDALIAEVKALHDDAAEIDI